MLILTANFPVSIENLKQTNKVLSENVFQSDLVYIFSKGCPNEHISNIIDFTDVLEIPDFGNCWETGIVRVLLNGTEIASASANTPSITIEFATSLTEKH